MLANKLPRSPDILSRHADIIRFERRVQDDLAFFAVLDDVNVRLVPALVARINDDAEAFDLYTRRGAYGNLRSVGCQLAVVRGRAQCDSEVDGSSRGSEALSKCSERLAGHVQNGVRFGVALIQFRDRFGRR